MRATVCSGPCLPTVWKHRLRQSLACAAFVYLGACVYYIYDTRRMGTPLKDSLTLEQQDVWRRSSEKRMRSFLVGAVVSSCVLCVWRPFSSDHREV